MKKILLSLSLISSAALPLLAEEAKQALIVEAPATWKVEFKGDNGIQFYTVTSKEGDTALLIFSRWPPPGSVNQIPDLIEGMAQGFADMAKDNKDFKLKTDKYKIEDIVGDTFSGSFVKFEVNDVGLQTMFMIGDDGGIWYGQFTGTKERWTEALAILKSLNKKG
jgi:hypothetical protein